MNLAGWGRFPRADCAILGMRGPYEARYAVQTQPSLIARGNGRSYGDAALNPDCVISTLRSDRIRDFDVQAGTITCEAGLLLADLLKFVVPRGFFPPVTPGTRFVTIGGMVAADVHGKNHHDAGSFCRHIESLELMTAGGDIKTCSPCEHTELFAATCGGMGLTGIILSIKFRLLAIETALIRQETLVANNIEESMALCEQSSGWTYVVAWIDCLARGSALGRSILYRGEHVTKSERPDASLAVSATRLRRMPFDVPPLALNKWTMRLANGLYYRRGKPGTTFLGYEAYFYPLDAILEWNRLYGKPGFIQYQCVIPRTAGRDGIRAILERVSAQGSGSLLAVLKLLGREGDGLLSFPLEGYTLALDFPVNAGVLNLMLELDAIVADHGGRLYLAKDSRAGVATLRGYTRLCRFRTIRAIVDPTQQFQSLQSRRLGL